MGLNFLNVGFAVLLNAGVEWATALLDWFKRIPITISGAAKTADFTDAFGSDGWTDKDSNCNVTGGVLGCVFPLAATDTGAFIDFNGGVVDANKWVLDVDFIHTAVVSASQHALFYFGLTADSTTQPQTNQDYVMLRFDPTTGVGGRIGCTASDGNSIGGGNNAPVDNLYGQNDQLYLRLIRDNDKGIMIVYTDSDRTEVKGTATFTIPSATNLRYLRVSSENNGRSTQSECNFDNVKFYDGVTVVENIPSQQTADDIFGKDTDQAIEDFTTYANTTEGDTGFPTTDTAKMRVNPTNDNLDFTGVRDSSNDLIYRDIGTVNISETAWVLDFKINFSTITTDPMLHIGLSDTTGGSNQLQDGIFLLFRPFDGTATEKLTAISTENERPQEEHGGNKDDGIDFTIATSTDYFFRITRESATIYTIKFYSDSARTIQLGTTLTGTITSSLNALRYFKVFNYETDTAGADLSGTIDDVKVWNNITEVNPATLTDYPLPVKIIGNTDLQRKTTETFTEDFDTDTWTNTNSRLSIDTTLEVMNFSVPASTTHFDVIIKDLTSVSDSKWVLDFELNASVISNNSDNTNQFIAFGISDSDQTVDSNENQDFIGMEIELEANNENWNALDSDGSTPQATGAETAFTHIPVVDRTYYCRIVRTSTTTFSAFLFSDSSRTILIERKDVTIASTIDSLRYVKGMTQNSDGTGNGTLTGIIDNVRFWDGITNPVNQEVATFEDDFTGEDAWTDDGTNCVVNEGTDVIDWTSDGTAVSDGTGFDLLTLVNKIDDKFVLRYKWIIDTNTSNSDGTQQMLFALLSSKNQASNRSDGNQDSVGCVSFISSNTNFFRNDVSDGAVLADGVPGSNSGSVNSTGTKYVEFIKDGDNFSVYVSTDSDYLFRDVYSNTQTGAGNVILQYLKFMVYQVDGTANGVLDGTVDNIEFWNGTTSPNASGRKFVFTDNVTDGSDTETQYSSEMESYDPINGDWVGTVRIPSLTAGADTTIQMYHDYLPSATPSYVPELIPTSTFNVTDLQNTGGGDEQLSSANNERVGIQVNNSSYFVDREVTEVSFWLKKAGSPTGTYYCRVYDTTNSLVTTFGSGDVSALTTGYVKTTFNSSTRTIQRDDKIVIEYTGGDGSNNLKIDYEFTADVFDGTNTTKTAYNPSTWSEVTDDDIRFEIISNLRVREQSTWDLNYKAVYNLQGNSGDSTVYGNDGTDTAVAYEQQNNSVGLTANGTTTKIVVTADTSIGNIWATGGSVKSTINPKSDGEGNAGRIMEHNAGWLLGVESESAGFMKLRLLVVFSGTNAQFTTTNAVIPINEISYITVEYNASSVSNTPIFIINGIKYTVGNGLTATTTPTGTVSDDSAQQLTISNETGSTLTFDGLIDELSNSDVTRPSSEAITSYNAEKSDQDTTTSGTQVDQ